MRHNNIILTTLFMGLAFFGCRKYEPENLTPKITDDKVEVTVTTATFSWTVDWPGKLVSVVEVSENEDMTDSRFYGSEEETNNHDFTVTATGLKEATKYYYRFLVWNKFYVDNKFVMEVKGFTTEADVPKVKTVEVTDVTRTSATVVGEVTDDCGAEVTECGVCWSTSHDPTTSGSHATGGTGLGSYSVALSGLEVGMTYYARAYAINSKGTAYGEELEFVTGDAVKPTVTTAEITNIDWRSATGGGEVTDDGDATVTERGICWSTSHNPEVTGSHANSGTGTGTFTINMTGLTAGTTYYVRAYAKNIAGVSYGEELSFATFDPFVPEVVTSAAIDVGYDRAIIGGEVTSDGESDVTERGVYWGTTSNPTTKLVIGSGTGVFSRQLTGLTDNTTYYYKAYAVNSVGESCGNVMSFKTLPKGATGGLFTINANGDKVWFSQGNLQYQASTGTWRFATNQYDYIGSANSNISSSYSGWIDLFGWGTSGYNHGAVCYQPWSTSTSYRDYYAYGNYQYNLYDQTGQADWGYNAISNGGNSTNTWRTPTHEEWGYVFNTRTTTSGIRYAKAKVNNVNGVILLPDDWSSSYYSLSNTNQSGASFTSNTVTASQWSTLEQHGAVFLPAAGYRGGTSVGSAGSYGVYWSSSYDGSYGARYVNFGSGGLDTDDYGSRSNGQSVRLVRSAQ